MKKDSLVERRKMCEETYDKVCSLVEKLTPIEAYGVLEFARCNIQYTVERGLFFCQKKKVKV